MQQPSTFAQARTIINADGLGLRGLNKGLTSTLGRHGVFNMIYFGFYFNVKDAIPASQVNIQKRLNLSYLLYFDIFSIGKHFFHEKNCNVLYSWYNIYMCTIGGNVYFVGS